MVRLSSVVQLSCPFHALLYVSVLVVYVVHKIVLSKSAQTKQNQFLVNITLKNISVYNIQYIKCQSHASGLSTVFCCGSFFSNNHLC